MEFDELYATHGDSACKAAETLRLRKRVSFQAWYQASLFSPDGRRRGAKWDLHTLFFPQLRSPNLKVKKKEGRSLGFARTRGLSSI
jgi:hypothetical protein